MGKLIIARHRLALQQRQEIILGRSCRIEIQRTDGVEVQRLLPAGRVGDVGRLDAGVVGAHVKIVLHKGPASLVLSEATLNDGHFQWSVYAFLPPDTDYTMEVVSVADPSIRDESDSTFTIIE